MSFRQFLADLFDSGRVAVAKPKEGEEEKAGAAVDELLTTAEAALRLEAPGEPPEFSLKAARWAATRFYRACQCIVYRDIDEAAIVQAFAEPCPATGETAAYSVDVVFRFLPDLVRSADSASENDPLVRHLKQWALAWPLSSVGLNETPVDYDIEPILQSPSLLQMYVDRILATNDASRLSDARIAEAVQCWGMYPELAPGVAAAAAQRKPQSGGAATKAN